MRPRTNDTQLGSDNPDNIDGKKKVLAKSQRLGFETGIPLPESGNARYLRAAATDSKGQIIGCTPVWDSVTGNTLPVDKKVTAYE